jgi:hypothetical protein
MWKKPLLRHGERRFHWLSNGHRRHAFEQPGDIEALCQAVSSSRYLYQPHAPCLACLHTIGMDVDWHDYFTFWRDARGVVEPQLDASS